MLEFIKAKLASCTGDGIIYLIKKLSDISGFFMTDGHLLYMVRNDEGAPYQSLTTDFLRLNTNVDITSIESSQQFASGKYNVIEFISETGPSDILASFVRLCSAHAEYLHGGAFQKFFFSLTDLFQCPREQQYKNLVGLFGELSFLRFAFQETGKDVSTGWHLSGPSSKYDIVLSSVNIEIKSTSSADEFVAIKHEQLFNADNNRLVVALIEENPSGLTLDELIGEMLHAGDAFHSYKFALNVEREKRRVSPEEAATKRFKVEEFRAYDAKVINPFQDIPSCICGLTYRLDLADMPQVKLNTVL